MSKYQIDLNEKIEFNNARYYIRIRTENVDNPVVLFLHGGPGGPDRAFTMKYQEPLASVCTLVAWDQRGAGKAYDKKEAKTVMLTKELYIEDAHNVILYLKKRFHKEKIIIVGHSFGSMLGLWLLEKYSADVQCFVGIGQYIDSAKNEDVAFQFTVDEAIKRGDKKALKKLNEIGPPVNGFYKNNMLMLQRKYLNKFGGADYSQYLGKGYFTQIGFLLIMKEYNLWEYFFKCLKGVRYCQNSPIWFYRVNFLESFKTAEVPIYLFLGHHDYNCSFALAEQWYNNLEAPYKKLVWFENSAHCPQFEEYELWNKTFADLILGKTLK